MIECHAVTRGVLWFTSVAVGFLHKRDKGSVVVLFYGVIKMSRWVRGVVEVDLRAWYVVQGCLGIAV